MKISNFKEIKKGDCFLIDINNDKFNSYSNMQIALIVMDKTNESEFNHIIFTVKLLQIVEQDSFEKLLLESEFIKVRKLWMEERYFPLNGSISLDEHIKYIKRKKCFPNEYGMLFDYNFIIILNGPNNQIENELKYVGNYEVKYPIDNYNNDKYANSRFEFIEYIDVEKLVNLLLDSYENYNLKKSEYFNKKKSEKERKNWIHLLKASYDFEIFLSNMNEKK